MATSQRKGASSTTKQQRRHLSNKDSKVSQQHLKQEREDESIFKIVYSATTQLITPPPSPKSHTLVSQSFEANDRVLSAKRQGQLKTLLSEYTALKKEGLLFTDHTYNLIFDAYAALRRDGTPLTTMLKMYDEMLSSHIQPSSSTYTILIRTLCKRDVEVQKLVALLKRQNARSSHHKNNTDELEAEENIQKALAMFDAAVSAGLARFFEAELYNHILRVLSHYGNTKKSLHVYHQLEMHSTPTSATFAALINLFGRVGDLGSALFYFNRYKHLKASLSHHDASYIYNALVDAHLKCDKLEGALEIIQTDMTCAQLKTTTIPYNSVIRYLCAKNRIEEARQFIHSMKNEPHFPQPDASSYGPVLSAYCQSGLLEEATEMYQSLVHTDISKSYGNLANYALLCLDHGEGKRVIQVFHDMHTAGLEPDSSLVERTLTTLAKTNQVSLAILVLQSVLETSKPRSLAKGLTQIKHAVNEMAVAVKGHYNQLLEIARLMDLHGLPTEMAKQMINEYNAQYVTRSDYPILFDAAIAVQSRPVVFFQLYDDMISIEKSVVDSRIHSHVSSYLSRIGDKKALYQWEAFFNKNGTVPFETGEASAAIMKSAISGHPEKSLHILNASIVQANLVPSLEPLRDAIAFIGKQGHLQIATSMYQLAIKCFKESRLESERIECAIHALTNSIMIGYAQQGDVINAKKYYEKIKLMGRYPDSHGYASLLLGSAQCATDEASDALLIYEEAKQHDVKPTTFFYNVVISKLAKARKLDAAMKLFQEMQTFHITPNAITYGAIISACVRAGSEALACQFFNEMVSSPSFQPRVGPFNNMIQLYVRHQPDRERALAYFEAMRCHHVIPSAYTYKLLMEVFSFITPYDMLTAHRILNDMEINDHIRPQANHYATLIHSYGILQRDVEKAELVFCMMKDKHISGDEDTYQAIIDTFISNDQLYHAEVYYREMQKTIQKRLSPYIENLFIRGYGQKGLLDKAKSIFDAMVDARANDGLSTVREPSTYEAMVCAYVENNKMIEAKEIFKLMVDCEYPEKVTASVAELINPPCSEIKLVG